MPDTWESRGSRPGTSLSTPSASLSSTPSSRSRSWCFFGREWMMHPNGQIPAYEWAFDDVNPPVHAWAAWRVYKIDATAGRQGDRLSSSASSTS